MLSIAGRTSAAGETTVELSSGRRFSGEIDPKTDEQLLWLRFGSGSAVILRPIAWRHVQSAVHEEKELSADAFRSLALSLPANDADALPPAPGPGQSELDDDKAPAALPTWTPPSRPASRHTAPVRSVRVDAFAANWDADVENDGLLVHVDPLGESGEILPVGGMLEVTLIAQRGRRFQDVPHGRGQVIRTLGRWTRRVWPEDVGAAGAVYKLPFQATHPEFQLDVGTHGLVHVRLTVPGQGVFEDSQDFVRIRPFSPLRDAYQLNHSRRFFPGERTGRSR